MMNDFSIVLVKMFQISRSSLRQMNKGYANTCYRFQLDTEIIVIQENLNLISPTFNQPIFQNTWDHNQVITTVGYFMITMTSGEDLVE